MGEGKRWKVDRSRQIDMVLARLRRGPLTDADARDELGISRLGARIYDLRRLGYGIHKETVTVLNRRGETCHVARYALMCSPGTDPGEEEGEGGARQGELEAGGRAIASVNRPPREVQPVSIPGELGSSGASPEPERLPGRSASPTPEPSLFGNA